MDIAPPADAAHDVELRLFGTPALLDAQGEHPFAPRRVFQLMAYLAARGSWVSRAELAELFWPDRPEGAARANLRVLLLRVQQEPRFAGLELQAERVRWPMPSDLRRFEEAAAAGDDETVLGAQGAVLLEGLEPGLPEPALEWLQRERERIAALWRGAAQRRLQALAAAGGGEAVAVLSARLAAADPEAAASGRALAAAAERRDGEAFIGRRAELAEIERRLAPDGTVRWLVVVGPGGIGKSALLRAALPRLAPAFGGAACLVPLNELTDAAQVPAGVLRALGSTASAARPPWAQAQAAIGTRTLLLALDNAEHLAGLDDALADLLAACPGLRLLVGSRVRTSHAAAATLPLEGLPVPDDSEGEGETEGAGAAEALRRFDSVRLFEARARAASPGFSLAAQPAAVLRMLRACDGMPLAIELAAAATRLLPVADIAAQMARSLEALDAASGRGERGLRVSFERSWRVLDEAARRGLAALAWLPAAFGREVAEVVGGVPLARLAALLDASLVQVVAPGRFALHPLLRQFVAERAGASLDAAALAARHAAWFGQWLAAFELPGRVATPQAADAIEAELGHLRASWAWAAAAGAATLLIRFAKVLGAYHVQRGRVQEILPFMAHVVATLARAGAAGRAGQAAHAHTLRTLAMLEYHAGDLPAAIAHAREALRAAGRAGDAGAALGCLTVLGNAWLFAGDARAARAHFEQAKRRAAARGETSIAASAANGLGLLERSAGRLDEALVHLREAGSLYARLGDLGGQISVLVNIGNVEMLQQRWLDARRTTADALALASAHRIEAKLALLHTILAEIALELEEWAVAERHIAAALAAEAASAETVVPTQLRLMQARQLAATGQPAAARDALAQAAERARHSGSTTMQLSCVNAAARLLAGSGEAEAAARLWHWVDTHPRATHSLRDAAQSGLAMLADAARPAALPAPDAAPEELLGGALRLLAPEAETGLKRLPA